MWVKITYDEYYEILQKGRQVLGGSKVVTWMVWKDNYGCYVAKSNGSTQYKWVERNFNHEAID